MLGNSSSMTVAKGKNKAIKVKNRSTKAKGGKKGK